MDGGVVKNVIIQNRHRSQKLVYSYAIHPLKAISVIACLKKKMAQRLYNIAEAYALHCSDSKTELVSETETFTNVSHFGKLYPLFEVHY